MANIYRYIRVSTKEQNEQRQLHKMMERGVEARRIFVDKASGRNFDRPQYGFLCPNPRNGGISLIH
nr:recombinase family protein [Bacillus toyonensis]